MPIILSNLGDVNPFDHGGWLVVKTEWGPQAVVWDVDDKEYDPTTKKNRIRVYRFDIDSDPMKDLDWANWNAVAQTQGCTTRHIRELASSGSVRSKAEVYRMVGDHDGYDNLDAYPEWETVAKLKSKYGKALERYNVKMWDSAGHDDN